MELNVEQRKREHALAARLLSLREQEVSWMKRELHDRLGPLLFAIGMNVKWVSEHCSHDPDSLRPRLHETLQLVEDAVQETRRLSSDLRSDALTWGSLGLEEALSEYAAKLEEQTRLPIQFSSELLEGEALEPEVASHIYHIVSEALTNAARHADATSIAVTLGRKAEELVIFVNDNGKGFAPRQGLPLPALGLKEMQARTQLIGGELEIASASDTGTTVRLRVPMPTGR